MSSLHATGGGRLTHFVCVNGDGEVIMPCGRCRQLLWENGGPELLLWTVSGVRPMTEVLPDAFGPDDLEGTAAMSAHDAVEVILAKRDGHELSDSQIDWVVDAYTRGEVADEQMSALAMAILLNGMDRREISRWTAAMIASGERMDFSGLSRPTADKHSTGGVGDKITLPLAPLVAACGVAVPQLSGRGLGHTGGTLDKLESIPGWRAALSNDEMLDQLESVGAVICAAGDGLAPADKKLYALRDVTGTVEAIPLIASSIMSKKIAEGTGALVLDVKVGSGAFMKDVDRARELAETMVALGTDAGVHTVALLTDMDTPLGRTAGNGVEVAESVEVLAGGGPADVVELTLALAREMLAGAGRDDVDPADVLAVGPGDGRLAGDDLGPGRRPGRRPPAGAAHPRRGGAGVRRADPARRDGRRHGGLAARRGPCPQGGPRAGRCRCRVARATGRRGHRGPAAAHPPHRRRGALRAGAGLAGGRLRRRRRRRGLRAAAAGDRPGRPLTMTGLDAERVRAAAARWVFVPVDAVDVTTEDYRLVHYADVSMVHRSATGRPLAGGAGGGRRPRAGGRPSDSAVVGRRTHPPDGHRGAAGRASGCG